jgi:hypothetical protein
MAFLFAPPAIETLANLTLNGTLTSTNEIAKAGAASLVLNGPTTTTLGARVTEGTLVVNNTFNVTEQNYGITTYPGATLAGNGTINADSIAMISGSTLSPGVNGPGTLTLNLVSNANTVFLGGTISMQITGTGGAAVAGTDFDSINFSPITKVQFSGPLTINFASALTEGATYNLFNFAPGNSFGTVGAVTITGAYNMTLTNIGGGVYRGGIFTFNPTYGTLVAVPEPGEWGAMIGVSLAALALLRRRKASLPG